MKRILIIFGTRPEVIKLAPVVLAAKEEGRVEVLTCATAQHRGLLDQVLSFFEIQPDYDLDLMKEGQTLSDLTARALVALREVMEKAKPDLVVVQGDTATAFTGALAGYYYGVKVAHVEAGLRTGCVRSPFPEEYFRKAIAGVADYHFAPTSLAAENLRKENVTPSSIHMTGNTVVDALQFVADRQEIYPHLAKSLGIGPSVLLTTHRRENFGTNLVEILLAVKEFAEKNPDVRIFYPVHPNPNVRGLAYETLGGLGNVILSEPLSYGEIVYVLRSVSFVVTDSGGLQEEAPTFGKPVLVLRDTTERPESVDAGCSLLVGHDRLKILNLMTLLRQPCSALYQSMSQVANPFGDGQAGKRIVDILAGDQSLKMPGISMVGSSGIKLGKLGIESVGHSVGVSASGFLTPSG